MIEHVERGVSGKAVQTIKKTCEKPHKPQSQEGKIGCAKGNRVLFERMLTVIEKIGEKKNIFFCSSCEGKKA